jgi:hypothetical protein
MRGAVVDDHEHSLGLLVGLLGHGLLDQLVKRDDPVLGSAAVKQLRASRVPRGEVAQRALALVAPTSAQRALCRPGGYADLGEKVCARWDDRGIEVGIFRAPGGDCRSAKCGRSESAMPAAPPRSP